MDDAMTISTEEWRKINLAIEAKVADSSSIKEEVFGVDPDAPRFYGAFRVNEILEALLYSLGKKVVPRTTYPPYSRLSTVKIVDVGERDV